MARVSPCEQSSHELWLEAPTSNTAKRTGFYLFFLLVGGGVYCRFPQAGAYGKPSRFALSRTVSLLLLTPPPTTN